VSWHRYTAAVDIWAVGCILAELLLRYPVFPGKDCEYNELCNKTGSKKCGLHAAFEQLELIADKIGKPPESFISKARRPNVRFVYS
jgi:serine/threonine protein kinase